MTFSNLYFTFSLFSTFMVVGQVFPVDDLAMIDSLRNEYDENRVVHQEIVYVVEANIAKDTLDDKVKPKPGKINCRPRITVNHFECDGSGVASIKASFKHLSIQNCGGPFDFYWRKKESNIVPKPLSGLFVSQYTVTEPGTYNLTIQDGNNVLFNLDIDVGYKYDWQESESAFSADFDVTGYNDIAFTQVLIPGSTNYYIYGKGEGARLPVGQTGWFEFGVENQSQNGQHTANLNWSNLSNILNANIGISISNQTLTYTTFVFGGSTTTASIPLADLDAFKIKRTDTDYEIYVNANDQYTLVHTTPVGSMHALNAFLKLIGLKIVDTYSSYPCSEQELTLFAPMRRDLDGELHHMSSDELRVIYNEPYETNTIQKLELIMDDEIHDLTTLVPSVNRGDNRWIIPLADNLNVEVSDVCILRLTNTKNEQYYLRIQMQ